MQIRLKVLHTHDEVTSPPGTVLEVDALTAQWLLKYGIGEHVAPPPKPSTAPVATKPAVSDTKENAK